MASPIHLADVSEFQSNIDWAAYDSDAVVLRVHNGNRPDRSFDSTRLNAARKRCKVVGLYGYVVASRDAAEQGKEFAQTFLAASPNGLRPGEFVACDLEEGSGDQTPRAEAWCGAVERVLKKKCWVYSSSAFRTEHLAGEARQFWEAAYQGLEPHDHHVLWQHSDHENHAGIGPCDCSIFDGSVVDLYNLISGQENAVALTPADLAAVKKIVEEVTASGALHTDIVTELRGTTDGQHPANLVSIYNDVEAIKGKLGA